MENNQVQKGISKDLNLIKDLSPEEKISYLESLFDSDLKDEDLEVICELIPEKDKGVRNSISFLLTTNRNNKIPFKIVPYIASPDITIRNFVGEILLRIGSGAVESLLNSINSGSDDDKKFLIDILGLIGDNNAAAKITKVLNSTENQNVILACIEALGNIKAEKSLYHLMAFYSLNELYKPTIIEALGKIGSPAALGFITSKYEEEDDLIKFSIIESLGLIGDEETFFFLLAELNEVEGPIVWPIIKSIYRLREKFGFDIPFDERMKHAVLKTIMDADVEYKKIAAGLLLPFNDREVISAYLRIYGIDPEIDEMIQPKFWENPQVVYEIIGELLSRNSGGVKSIFNLLSLLKDIIQLDGEEKYSNVSSLFQRNLSEALSIFLSDSDEEVRRLSLELLFILDKNTALLFVPDFAEDNNIWNRLKLIELLEEVIHPKADEALAKLVNDPEEMVKERADYCLSKRNHK